MILILLIGVLLVGVAAWLLARALVFPRLRAAQTVQEISSYGLESTGRQVAATSHPATAESAREGLDVRRALDTLATTVGQRLTGRVSSTREEQLRRHLMEAGLYTTPPGRILGYQALGGIVLPALWLWLTVSTGTAAILILLGLVLTALGGWTLPMTILKRRGQRRIDQIDYEMPELIDTLVTTVEAGIAFNASLQIAAQRFRGPLAEELRLTIQEQNMGLATGEALEHMLDRCDTPAVRSFVRSIVQGELLGVSIGRTLRNLASEMRKRRRQRAEERAQKAPVKMLFPLVFLLLPAMFVIVLGPAVLQIGNLFGH